MLMDGAMLSLAAMALPRIGFPVRSFLTKDCTAPHLQTDTTYKTEVGHNPVNSSLQKKTIYKEQLTPQ